MLPEVLDFRITSRCNMNCSFCFGTKRREKLNISILRNFLIKLQAKGVKNIVLTGGEPTLAPDFEQIILLLKQLNFNIVISTNGTFWNNDNLKSLVIKYTNWMALPVDSTIINQHNRMRGVIFNHYALIMRILDEVNIIAPQIKIKIGTVVTKENIQNIQEIIYQLPKKPDLWKLYQLSESSTNAPYYNQNRIEDKAFKDLVYSIQQYYKDSQIRIIGMHEREREQQYLFLDPDGDLITIENNREVVLGNYCDDFDKLIGKIGNHVNDKKTNVNYSNSFG